MLPGFSQQVEKGLNSSTGDYLGFLEYKPADYSSNTTTKYPLIIFLHGIGERGNGTTMLQDVTCCGIPRIIRLGNKMRFTWNGKTETFLVLSPQCPEKYGMWPAVFITELINYAKANLRIDPNRIYLTGLSMGGGGTLRFISTAAEQPKQLAAAATICAPCTFSNPVYPADAHLPYWGFHAADDPTAPVSCTEYAVKRMNDVNANPKPLLTIWPTGGHIVWDRVYTDTAYKYDGVVNIYEWFLGQNKSLPVNILPVARAGNTINITTGTATAMLDGSASTDADGKLVRYVWRKISGPTAGVITTPFGTSSSTTVTGLTTAGTYKYQLNVVDNRAAVSRDTLTVVVSSGASETNIAPVAKAGADATITLPTSIYTLNGSASSDQDGTIKSYLWTKVSGPAVTISNSATASTAISGLVQGTYVFKLKVTDDKGATGEDQVTVTVNAAPNAAPVAKAGADVSITLPTNSVTLNGSGSTDIDGTISSYLWTKVSGPAATIANASGSSTAINGLVEGTYVFKLKVVDNDGASSEDQVTVVVNAAPNAAPVAKAGADITITLPTNTVTLNGTGSTDSDGTIASYLWTKVSGSTATITNASGSSTSINGLVEGTYVFKLKVTDNDGASSEDQVTVKVNPAPNASPVAKAGADITITLPANTVTLAGTGSTDSDGTIVSYLWTKVSGPAATIVNATGSSTAINGLVEGTYVFKLKVTDNDGAISEDQVTVKVNPAANQLPQAKAGNDITITLPTNRTSVSGIASTDPDGSIVSYAWAKLSGPSQFIIADATAALTSITNLVEGTYAFRLVVTDNDGATDADTITIKVNPEPPQPNVAPVAQAGQNQTITLPVDNVTLNGTGSTDQDGTIAAYTWTYLSGPATYSLNNATTVTATVTGMVAGTYTFRLEVKDNDGATDADTISIIVEEETAPPPPPNVDPVADAGSDIVITLPVNQATLHGDGSVDADGTITKYSWKKIGGPASFNIVTPNSNSTIIENLVEGTYKFQLTVKDNDGALSNDTVTITVNPAPNETPSSDAGPDMQVQLPDPNIELDGADSYDPDGTIASYKWEQVSGPNTATITNETDANTNVTGVVEGVYWFRLTVTDNDGTRASDAIKITVLAADIPNVAPVAKAGTDVEITLPDASVQFDGSTSSDADGTLVSYSWSQLSGPSNAIISNASASKTNVSALEEGEYIFQLTVQDNDGGESSDQVKVIVHAAIIPNARPVADAGGDVDVTLPDASTQLDGSRSSDADGTIVSYNWVKVSGPGVTITNSDRATPGIVGVEEGEYVFRLTVTDNDGAESSDEVRVTVRTEPVAPVNEVPVANAGGDQTISYPDTSLTINGTSSSDVDGNIADYEWTMVDGPAPATIINPSSPSTVVSNLQTGEYKFVLTVVDNKGAISRDTVAVSVINTQRFVEEFKVYPNPARSEVKVDLVSDTLGTTRVTIYNTSGMIVQSLNVEKAQPHLLKTLNVSNLQTGIYYLEVIVDGKVRKITKFMKQQ
jgi:predicted esterase